ncbi:MAG: adenine phosphoribosyltransferase, partial [Clostridiaceae bacterium]|nr:adenine phosphoribosyltransferase [Clostridiaceae bacterium]
MKYYDINIAGIDRSLPLCRVTDSLYIAAFVVFGDVELTIACAKRL